MKFADGTPGIDTGALHKQSVSDYLVRFTFGAGISGAAAVAGLIWGQRLGGVLLGFPAILPASLTLIERKSNREEAVIDATGAIIGACGLVLFAVAAAWFMQRFNPAVAVVVAGMVWLGASLVLYRVVLLIQRRKAKSRGKAG